MCRCFKFVMLGVMAISAGISFGYETIVLGDYTYTYEVQRYISSTNTIVRGISPLKGDIVIPDVIAGYKVTSVDVSFKNNKEITSISFPTSVAGITDERFYSCSQLTNVTWRGGGEIKWIGEYAFAGCGFRHFEIPSSVTSVERGAFANCTNLSSVIIGNRILGESQFYGCSSLVEISIPDGVTKIPEFAFSDCRNLRHIEIPDTVSVIGRDVFSGCYAIEQIALPSGIDSLSIRLFADCTNLVKVTFSDKLKEIRTSAFDNTAITEFEVPESVTNIESSVFYGCRYLTNVTINAQVEIMGQGLFNGCSMLEKIELPNALKNIGPRTFSGCKNLSNIEIPIGVTNIGYSAFSGCSKITRLDIPESVVSIGQEAYRNSGLKDPLIIPDCVERIDYGAFRDCPYTNVVLGAGIEYLGYSYNSGGVFAQSPLQIEVRCRLPEGGGLPLGNGNVKYAVPEELAFSWRDWLMENEMSNSFIKRDYPKVNILSAQMREGNPSVMDIEYRVDSADDSPVNVRAVAYVAGRRSLTNLILPKTFVEGTAANVGDSIAVNRNLKLSWCVAADTEFSEENLRFEILAARNGGLPLELINIPSIGETSVAYPPLYTEVFDALLWRYADETEGLELIGDWNSTEKWKELQAEGKTLAVKSGTLGDHGTHSDYALTYLYGLMGYDILTSYGEVASALRSPCPYTETSYGSLYRYIRYPVKPCSRNLTQVTATEPSETMVSVANEEPVFTEIKYAVDVDGSSANWSMDYLEVGGSGQTWMTLEDMVWDRDGEYIFTHWSCNGSQELASRDKWGRAFEAVNYTAEEGLVLTAHFLSADRDVDGDGVPDGYELYWYGNLNANALTDSDGDGRGFLREIEMESNPLFAEYYNGGFTRTAYTKSIAYNRASASVASVVVKDSITGNVTTNTLPLEQALNVANMNGGQVLISGLIPSSLEVSPGVAVTVDGFLLTKEEIDGKIVIKPIDTVQDVKFFKIRQIGGVTGETLFKVVIDEEAIGLPQTAKNILSAIMEKSDRSEREIHLTNAKEGFYYGVISSESIDGLNGHGDVTFHRAGSDGVVLTIQKPSGKIGFAKIIVSDRP